LAFRVLVVDDSPVTRYVVRRAIEISGLPVDFCVAAEHGKAALSLLKEHRIDMALVNLNMPEMGGKDLIRGWQHQEPQRKIPFIVMSADATATRIEEMLALGALAYLAKPFTAETLRREMQRGLEQIHACN
jgi:CheY-like chemotaxis protein